MNNLEYINLFDIYGNLLTLKQQDTFKMYYMSDLSLREIAENLEISFQAVRNCLNECRKKLLDYEDKLKVNKLLIDLKKINNKQVNKCLNEYNKGNI